MMVGKNRYIFETVNRMPLNSVGVELGVWRGDSSAVMAQKTSRLHLVDSWSIEPYKKTEMYEDYIQRYKGITGSDNPKQFMNYYDSVYNSVVERFANNINIQIWRMDTNSFFKMFEDKVDWFYVDASHEEEGVYEDLVNTYNYLKKQGYGTIYGDDYGNKAGVVKGVDKFLKDYNLKLNNFYKNQYEIVL
tara:strand:- start:1149 stop:1718 length:570 start_codon:yes stop_codon:yes gene_type:complete